MKTKLLLTIIFLSYLCLACSSGRNLTPPDKNITGVYVNIRPNPIEQVRIEMKMHARMFPLPVTMLYLRADSTYILGYCDNQVKEVGRYRLIRDSVCLYDRFDLFERNSVASGNMLYEASKEEIYFLGTNKYYKQQGEKIKPKVIPFKKNAKYAHSGFLRGQEMSKDSLIHHYELRSVDEQIAWTDSVVNASGQ